MRKLLSYLANLAVVVIVSRVLITILENMLSELWLYEFIRATYPPRDILGTPLHPLNNLFQLLTYPLDYFALLFGPLAVIIVIWAAVRLLHRKRPQPTHTRKGGCTA